MAVMQTRNKDGGVLEIVLLDPLALGKVNGGIPVVVGIPEERTEHRIAVETRKAAPYNTGPCIDKRAQRTVANQGQI
jgi:hypothetical protein